MDLQAITEMLMTHVQRQMADRGFTPDSLEFDTDEINRLLARIPSNPDERLR
jgi:hypothetical protein